MLCLESIYTKRIDCPKSKRLAQRVVICAFGKAVFAVFVFLRSSLVIICCPYNSNDITVLFNEPLSILACVTPDEVTVAFSSPLSHYSLSCDDR
jgi:hypothetical protein